MTDRCQPSGQPRSRLSGRCHCLTCDSVRSLAMIRLAALGYGDDFLQTNGSLSDDRYLRAPNVDMAAELADSHDLPRKQIASRRTSPASSHGVAWSSGLYPCRTARGQFGQKSIGCHWCHCSSKKIGAFYKIIGETHQNETWLCPCLPATHFVHVPIGCGIRRRNSHAGNANDKASRQYLTHRHLQVDPPGTNEVGRDQSLGGALG
jgi:hypothetical protein